MNIYTRKKIWNGEYFTGQDEHIYQKENLKRGVSQFGLAVRRSAGKQKGGLSSIPLRLSLLFKKAMVCGHCLVTLSLQTKNGSRRCSGVISAGGDNVAKGT